MKDKAGVPNIFGKKKDSNSNNKKESNFPWGAIITTLIILFILLGGINQRKAIESLYDIGENIRAIFLGAKLDDSVKITEDGVYIKP